MTFRIVAPGMDVGRYAIGESICVNGVCLTATAWCDDGFSTDVSRETLDVTALGELTVGSDVNLEPSLALAQARWHLVSGHVDCMATLVSRRSDARSLRLEFELPSEFARYVARKGSVCIDA